MTTITRASHVRRADLDDFVYTEVDGELVFMNVGESRFHGLRDAGVRVWELVGDGEGTTGGALVEALCEEFDVDEETCLRDVSVLLDEMAAGGVLTIDGEASAP